MQLPEPHAAFVENALVRLRADHRIVGVAIGGSALTDNLDEFSDLDLVIAVETPVYDEVLGDRLQIANSLGPLLSGFTGEHVGEPRLLICLYGPPPLHVDLKFVRVDDFAKRVEDPLILWERDQRLISALAGTEARYPGPDLEWIEDRFWVWVHYGAARIGRGELLEAIDMLSFLRRRVLGPLALLEAEERPSGVRRIESRAPGRATELHETLGGPSAEECADALYRAAQVYREIKTALGSDVGGRSAAEKAAMAYLEEIRARISRTSPI